MDDEDLLSELMTMGVVEDEQDEKGEPERDDEDQPEIVERALRLVLEVCDCQSCRCVSYHPVSLTIQCAFQEAGLSELITPLSMKGIRTSEAFDGLPAFQVASVCEGHPELLPQLRNVLEVRKMTHLLSEGEKAKEKITQGISSLKEVIDTAGTTDPDMLVKELPPKPEVRQVSLVSSQLACGLE